MSKNPNVILVDQSGALAVIAGLAIVVLLGFVALALDIGHLVAVKSELQKAADAGAIAGARGLWPVDLRASTTRDPDCSTGIAATRARSAAMSNKVDGTNLTAAEVTVDFGRWNYATRTFTASGCNPNTNAVRVITTRNNILMLFARIIGISSRNCTAIATAIMDFTRAVGKGTLPIAINKMYTNPGTELVINFTPDPLDNGGWFADPPDRASASTFRDYIENASCPPLEIGDIINLQNGEDTSSLKLLKDKLALHPGGWLTFLPVVDTDKFNQAEPIVEFVPFKITEVQDTSNPKYVKGTVMTLGEMASALPGGGKYGALAPPKLVN